MKRQVVALAMGLMLVAAARTARAQTSSAQDSLFRRAQQQINSGNAAAGRTLADSLFRATAEGTDARANALFWRATLASDSAAARRDLLVLTIEYPRSARAPDALLRLSQDALARGDRGRATSHLEQLVLDYRNSSAAPEAWYLLGRTRLESSDLAGGCAALDSARLKLRPEAAERRSQIAYASQPCAALARSRETGGAVATSETGRGVGDASRGAKPDSTVPVRSGRASTSSSARTSWSAQVAAVKTRADADRVVRNMKSRGYDARIDSLTLFHVRIGAYAKRADAVALISRLKRQSITAILVEVRREP